MCPPSIYSTAQLIAPLMIRLAAQSGKTVKALQLVPTQSGALSMAVYLLSRQTLEGYRDIPPNLSVSLPQIRKPEQRIALPRPPLSTFRSFYFANP